MKNLLLTCLALLALPAFAADVGEAPRLDDFNCTSCHGVDGRGNIGVQAPRLAGLSESYLLRQLQNFRAGIRGAHPDDEDGQAMQAIAQSLDPAGIPALLDWIGSWTVEIAEETLSGNSNQGRTLYQRCAVCHGNNAEGIEAVGAPALAGQNDWYLVKQLNNFRRGLRGNHPEDRYGAQMIPMAITLPSDQAIINVVTYINSLARQGQ